MDYSFYIMEEDYKFAKLHILLHSSVLSMKDTISKELCDFNGQAKLTILVQLVLEKCNDLDVRTKELQSDLVLGSCKFDLDQSLHDITEKLFRDIMMIKGCKSDWIVSKLQRLDFSIAKG